jgi:A/G-specific adenine glycosylase
VSEVLPPDNWDLVGFQQRLLTWYSQNGRRFPWRETADPYAILIAEKLLQQTQARESVISAYQALLSTYPSPGALAKANLADVRAIVQPLGLAYRAAELIGLAASLVSLYDGVIPDSLVALMALPGVGDYSARAVLSFAFGYDVAIVDTNVARIFYRVFGIPGPMPSNPARKRSLIDLATALLPAGQARQFNLALLDLGALICTPRAPDCEVCPVLKYCDYGKANL